MERKIQPGPVVGRIANNDLGKATGRLNKTRVVEQRESLLRGVRLGAQTRAFVPVGGVEIGQHRVEKSPLPMHVKPAPPLAIVLFGLKRAFGKLHVAVKILREINMGARAADIATEQARDGKRVVADKLRIQTARVLRRQKPVRRIHLPELRPLPRGALVCFRAHDEPDHVPKIPTALLKLGGQPVEQFGVTGRLSLRPQVIEHGAEARPEKLLPQPIHHRPGSHRILSRGEPMRQLQTPLGAPLGARQRRNETQRLRLHDRAGFILPVPPRQKPHRIRRHRLRDHGEGASVKAGPLALLRGHKLMKRFRISPGGFQPESGTRQGLHRPRLVGIIERRKRRHRNANTRRRPFWV